MCPNCRAFVTTNDRVCPYCDAEMGPRAVERRVTSDALGGLIPHVRFTTVMILLINTALFVADYISPQSGLLQYGASVPWPAMQGQWWRLVTAGFLHGGILHILMNSWVLFDLGAAVEEVYGGSRMLVIYFVSSVLGFYVSALWNPGVPSVGASAALFGLVGAMLAV